MTSVALVVLLLSPLACDDRDLVDACDERTEDVRDIRGNPPCLACQTTDDCVVTANACEGLAVCHHVDFAVQTTFRDLSCAEDPSSSLSPALIRSCQCIRGLCLVDEDDDW